MDRKVRCDVIQNQIVRHYAASIVLQHYVYSRYRIFPEISGFEGCRRTAWLDTTASAKAMACQPSPFLHFCASIVIWPAKPKPDRAKAGWGTWIRTRTDGVRVRRSTVNLFPNRSLTHRNTRCAVVWGGIYKTGWALATPFLSEAAHPCVSCIGHLPCQRLSLHSYS